MRTTGLTGSENPKRGATFFCPRGGRHFTNTWAELRFDQATLDDVDVRALGRSASWVELDGEGRPGLLTREPGGLRYKRNLSGGALAKNLAIPQIVGGQPSPRTSGARPKRASQRRQRMLP